MRSVAIWAGLGIATLVPIAIAATSPLLQWREPVYIIAGFAGVIALANLLLQPLLAMGVLPGLSAQQTRRTHRILGALLVAAIVVHVGGLWITSPPDVIDALTFTSPTPFSAWGVIAMWAAFSAAALALIRKRLKIRPTLWRIGHTILVSIIAIGTIIHAILIDGTMGITSKLALCALVALALGLAIRTLRPWAGLKRRSTTQN
ncbi:MAG: ferric reductase-like transmembrane domain-containing protein [Pseudomonadota bacterium]